eukprot:TRINITY_DN16430_c0_g1_i5.p1 TRINITY_DN16430_c0_g1~~TRINITY_DN16430_c0_g1_i5.p1  ORF type:complete len:760 (+),score=57.36 TRINITY_DN16430_c0_g1_i5:86-2365(+)
MAARASAAAQHEPPQRTRPPEPLRRLGQVAAPVALLAAAGSLVWTRMPHRSRTKALAEADLELSGEMKDALEILVAEASAAEPPPRRGERRPDAPERPGPLPRELPHPPRPPERPERGRAQPPAPDAETEAPAPRAAAAERAASAALSTQALPCSQFDFVVSTSLDLPRCHVRSVRAEVNATHRGPAPMVPVSSLPDKVLVRRAACGEPAEQMEMLQRVRQRTAQPRRFAICHFGLTRSISYTIGSVRANVYAPLAREGIPFSVFFHTYDVSRVESSQAGRTQEVIDWRRDVGTLFNFSSFQHRYNAEDRPRGFLQVDTQYGFDSTFNWKLSFKIHKFGDRDPAARLMKKVDTRDNRAPASSWFINAMRLLFSVKRVTALWQHHQSMANESFRAVLYVRQDMVWLAPFPPAVVDHFRTWNGPDRIYLPAWVNWMCSSQDDTLQICMGNDRAAIGTPRAMLRFGNRLDYALAMCTHTRRGLQSEAIVAWPLGQYSDPQRSLPRVPVIRYVDSHKHGGCLDVGIGVESTFSTHVASWMNPGMRDKPKNPILAGAYGVRARATELYLGQYETSAILGWFYYSRERGPDCGGLRASLLRATRPLRKFVCITQRRWCTDECMSQAPGIEHWIDHPPQDSGFHFLPPGLKWEQLVRAGHAARFDRDADGGLRTCGLSVDPYMSPQYNKCLCVAKPAHDNFTTGVPAATAELPGRPPCILPAPERAQRRVRPGAWARAPPRRPGEAWAQRRGRQWRSREGARQRPD